MVSTDTYLAAIKTSKGDKPRLIQRQCRLHVIDFHELHDSVRPPMPLNAKGGSSESLDQASAKLQCSEYQMQKLPDINFNVKRARTSKRITDKFFKNK